jgi:protein gp37
MSDFFIEEADEWRDDAWKVIKQTPQHQWQILTKRPERIMQCLPKDWGDGYENVWLGVSVESQDYLYRAKILSEIPANIRFISAEPLIGEIDINKWEDKNVLDVFQWCIIGGESGNDWGKYRYRECKVEWIEKIMADFKKRGIKVFVKQLGTYLKKKMNLKDWHGGNISEWPAPLRLREFPDIVNSKKEIAPPERCSINEIEDNLYKAFANGLNK